MSIEFREARENVPSSNLPERVGIQNRALSKVISKKISRKASGVAGQVSQLHEKVRQETKVLTEFNQQLRLGKKGSSEQLSHMKAAIQAMRERSIDLEKSLSRIDPAKQPKEHQNALLEIDSINKELDDLEVEAVHLERLMANPDYVMGTELKKQVSNLCEGSKKETLEPATVFNAIFNLNKAITLMNNFKAKAHRVDNEIQELLDEMASMVTDAANHALQDTETFTQPEDRHLCNVMFTYVKESLQEQFPLREIEEPKKTKSSKKKMQPEARIPAYRSVSLLIKQDIKPLVIETEQVATRVLELRQTIIQEIGMKPKTRDALIKEYRGIVDHIKSEFGKFQKDFSINNESNQAGRAATYMHSWEDQIKYIEQELELLEKVSEKDFIDISKSVEKGYSHLEKAKNYAAAGSTKRYENAMQHVNEVISSLKNKLMTTTDDEIQHAYLKDKIALLEKALEEQRKR